MSISTSKTVPGKTINKSIPLKLPRDGTQWHASKVIKEVPVPESGLYRPLERRLKADPDVVIEEESFSLGRAFALPKGVWRGKAPEDILQPFSNSEKIFAQRLGVRLDQDYDMDLEG